MKQLDLSDAKQSEDIDDISWNRNRLSEAVRSLDKDLTSCLDLASKDETIPIEQLKDWRNQQNQIINEIKAVIKTLNKKLDLKHRQLGQGGKSPKLDFEGIEKEYAQKTDPSRKPQFSSCRSAEAYIETEHNMQEDIQSRPSVTQTITEPFQQPITIPSHETTFEVHSNSNYNQAAMNAEMHQSHDPVTQQLQQNMLRLQEQLSQLQLNS